MNDLEIGLVNNMPDAALEATERQFRSLIDASAGGARVRLTFYALPGIPRSESGQAHVSRYSDIDDLWNGHLDGLIVTGTEPRASNLRDEPYWENLARLLEWAEHRTYSAVWSCLAAHAAVLHLDGISRRRLDDKRFGVFNCSRASDHALMASAPSRFLMPHSRWNDLPEDALMSRGYDILTRSGAGVDAFAKQGRSLFVFFQGHPEYEPATLLLEYRRDIKRFLRGERETYPLMPQDYFDEGAVLVLAKMEERARSERGENLIEEFPTDALLARVTDPWRPAATCVYGNWLRYISSEKARRIRAG
jgi:homoserine O-succinyltransferase